MQCNADADADAMNRSQRRRTHAQEVGGFHTMPAITTSCRRKKGERSVVEPNLARKRERIQERVVAGQQSRRRACARVPRRTRRRGCRGSAPGTCRRACSRRPPRGGGPGARRRAPSTPSPNAAGTMRCRQQEIITHWLGLDRTGKKKGELRGLACLPLNTHGGPCWYPTQAFSLSAAMDMDPPAHTLNS